MIDIAVKCRGCGQWTHKRTNDVNKCMFKCFICTKAGKLKDWKGNWNYSVQTMSKDIDHAEVIGQLNIKQNE